MREKTPSTNGEAESGISSTGHPLPEARLSTEESCFSALIGLARYLRGPEGCPWDREQTATDFARYAAEEVQEYCEALQREDIAEIEAEFGDALFVLLASAAAAEEQGMFTLHQALRRAYKKMIQRHDHVFGPKKAQTAEEAVAAWNRIKAAEKEQKNMPSDMETQG